jgi:hypothetical protein
MALWDQNMSWGRGVKFLNFKWEVALMTEESVYGVEHLDDSEWQIDDDVEGSWQNVHDFNFKFPLLKKSTDRISSVPVTFSSSHLTQTHASARADIFSFLSLNYINARSLYLKGLCTVVIFNAYYIALCNLAMASQLG